MLVTISLLKVIYWIIASFFKLLGKDFNWKAVPLEQQDPEFNSPDIRILHIKRNI